jgi:sulfur transfer complex TusBCD TusB component (DsrH family)
MHLLSKKQTVLKGLLLGGLSIIVGGILVIKIFESDVFGIVVYAILAGVYASSLKDYVKAFKKRTYDREYAKAKDQLQQTLKELLPGNGQVTFTQDDKITLIHRGVLIFIKKEFFTIFLANVEVLYDDLAARNLMVSYHSYNLTQSILYVSKSFDTMMASMNEDGGIQAQPVPQKIGLLAYIRESSKANRSIPEDLRYASPQELQDLRNLLREGREDIVS